MLRKYVIFSLYFLVFSEEYNLFVEVFIHHILILGLVFE